MWVQTKHKFSALQKGFGSLASKASSIRLEANSVIATRTRTQKVLRGRGQTAAADTLAYMRAKKPPLVHVCSKQWLAGDGACSSF
ncbi:hypothetical protein TYRP_022882 [Tyrophagus putrescentiae]|nr:hypothetical protein TYRP_022882 [Tyrophagus putrescentiae]